MTPSPNFTFLSQCFAWIDASVVLQDRNGAIEENDLLKKITQMHLLFFFLLWASVLFSLPGGEVDG